MGISKGLNLKEFPETDSAYYKMEFINDQIQDRRAYNLLNYLEIEKAYQSTVEKTIKGNITDKKDGLKVLLQKAKEEVESVHKKRLSLRKVLFRDSI